MSYPHQTGFVAHSQTSAASARLLDESGVSENQAKDINRRLLAEGAEGSTADEMTLWMKQNGYPEIYNGTVAGRLVHLEKLGLVVKTGKTRTTRSNRQAWVYVAHEFKHLCPPCPEPSLPKARKVKPGAVDPAVLRAALAPFQRFTGEPALLHHVTLTGPEMNALRDLAEQVCGGE